MRWLIPAMFMAPFAAAAAVMALRGRRRVQRLVALATLASILGGSVLLLLKVRHGEIHTVNVGAWPAPTGITLVVDTFSALLLAVSNAVLLAVLVYAVGQGEDPARTTIFHSCYLVLAGGVSLAYITGDLFNLFVAIEIVLAASYVLITLRADTARVQSAMTYIVINLLASTLLIAAIALTYAATGTVNLAHLSVRLQDAPGEVRDALGVLFVVVFGIKAGLFPLFFWLPDSYPTAPAPVTAIFAGLLTKVGVYAIIRSQTLLFPGDGPSTLLLAVAGLTMVVGVLGALAQNDIRRILSFHIISQIGYMIMGLALFSVAGIAGAIFYMVHHIPVKTGLFLAAGLIERAANTSALDRLGGLARSVPVVAVLFAIPALSIAGVPPFSGFVAKLGLVQAGFEADQYLIVAVSLVVSLLTLVSMIKIWTGAFWGEPTDSDATAPLGSGPMVGACVGVVAVVLIVGFGAGPVWTLASEAAQTLAEPHRYRDAVLNS